MTREELLALADEIDADAENIAGYLDSCEGNFSKSDADEYYKFARWANRIREAVERDGDGATTVSAYDLLSDDDRKAIAWVREHGGLVAVEKRLMPEGMEWPRYTDGSAVEIGDEVVGPDYGERIHVDAVKFHANGFTFCDKNGFDKWYEDDDRFERSEPKVLDADGVEIRVGDRLYDTDTGCGRTVRAVNDNGTVEFDGYENRGWFGLFLTHRAPVLAADGKPLEVGQTVLRDDGEMLEVLYLRPDGLVDCCGEIERPERLTHERPVLDADGVPIKKRDTVWHVASGREYVVVEPSYGETVVVRLVTCDDVEREQYAPDQLTHTKPEPPDTYAKLYEDVHDERCGSEEFVRRCRAMAEMGA